jgi:hypothetical protein
VGNKPVFSCEVKVPTSSEGAAARQITRDQNYPRVGTHDFFKLNPGDALVSLPLGPQPSAPRTPIALPSDIDAIVGNPPYIRRQAIDTKTRRFAERAVERSSSWLQSRYGAQLKRLLLKDYKIEFIAETVAEPWFSDARVKTVATVARKRQRQSLARRAIRRYDLFADAQC